MKPNEHNAQFSVLIILFFFKQIPVHIFKKKKKKKEINAALHECFHIFTCTVLVKK